MKSLSTTQSIKTRPRYDPIMCLVGR